VHQLLRSPGISAQTPIPLSTIKEFSGQGGRQNDGDRFGTKVLFGFPNNFTYHLTSKVCRSTIRLHSTSIV
jgi:hypothetical protein